MNFDLLVIGSGPGGYVAAIRASQLGLKTAVVVLAQYPTHVNKYPGILIIIAGPDKFLWRFFAYEIPSRDVPILRQHVLPKPAFCDDMSGIG